MISAVLATCLVCSIVQMFDRWDHELQTGQDTESAFVVLALCIGAAFVLARAVRYISKAGPVRTIDTVPGLLRSSFEMLACVNSAAFLSASPPSAILRI